MTPETVASGPLYRNAEDLQVGDVISGRYLPEGRPGVVRFVVPYIGRRHEARAFVVYLLPDGEPYAETFPAKPTEDSPLAGLLELDRMAEPDRDLALPAGCPVPDSITGQRWPVRNARYVR